MTLSGYFTSKSVFDQQSCRALTFALAGLSCNTRRILTSHSRLNITDAALTYAIQDRLIDSINGLSIVRVNARSYRVAPAEWTEELVKSTQILEVILSLVRSISNA